MDVRDSADEELRAALRSLEESVPDTEGVPRVKVGGEILRPAVLFGTAILAIILVVTAQGWLPAPVGQGTPSPGISSGTPSAVGSPSPDASPISPPELAWVTQSFPGGSIAAAAGAETGWVALGDVEAWFSPDGTTWQEGSIEGVDVAPWDPALTLGPPHPIAVARVGETWYALSRLEFVAHDVSPVVFTSSDGHTWTYLPSSAWWGQNPTALASDGKLLIATNVGPLGGQGSVFVSANGIDWAEHVAPGGPASMVDVYAGPGDRIVAVGYRASDEELEIPVVWVSDDGSSWTEAQPIDAERATTPRAVERTVTGAFVMLTTVTTFPADCAENACLIHTLGAWYSADGYKWQKAQFPAASAPFGTYREIDLLPISGGLLAVTSTREGSSAWVTADGVTWKAAEFTDLTLAISAGASNGDSVLLFGTSGEVVAGKAP